MDETAPVRPDEQMDWQALRTYLAGRVPDADGPMTIDQFPGGSANLTYRARFEHSGCEYVIRRPPLGPVAPGAHDMGREHRVLSRLWQVFDRAPRCFHFCEDETVIGAPFIVVERRRGVVIRDEFPAEMRHHERLAERTSYALVDAMADMHQVDADAIGLGKLGRPDGFVARQVSGWADRWEHAKDADVPLFGEIQALLEHHLPAPQRTSIVHNDLKLDNCQFDPSNPDRAQSIFDWDMATLGDPLIDLGTLLNYWNEPGDPEPRGKQATGAADVFPTRAQIARRYADASGLDLSGIAWYEAFALWKTAVVVQQIYIRFKRGQTQDTRFATYNERVPNLLQQARALL